MEQLYTQWDQRFKRICLSVTQAFQSPPDTGESQISYVETVLFEWWPDDITDEMNTERIALLLEKARVASAAFWKSKILPSIQSWTAQLWNYFQQEKTPHRKSRFAEMTHLLAQINNFLCIHHPEICINLIKQISEYFEDGGEDEIVSEAAEDLKAWEHTELTIAVTGDTGAGKSSFINAIRGLRPSDVGAAPIGVTETTQKPGAYEHPNFPNVIFWDLPGIGTPGFPPETYLKQVNFSHYDFFIIVSSKRFRSSDAHLAQEIQAMGKTFYFIRSKVDEDLSNAEKADPETYSEEQILQEIRDDCKKNLETHLKKHSNPQVFLTSCWDLDKYDFPLLLETLEKDLPSLKRLAFLLSLPNTSPEVIQKKKDALNILIWKTALVSAFVNVMPLGDHKLSFDADLILKTITGFYKKFGLDDSSLGRLARRMKKPVEELKAVIQSPPEKDIDRNLWVKQYISFGGQILTSVFPGKGHVFSGVLSFVATYWTLSEFLDQVAEDAKRVLVQVESCQRFT